MRVGRPVYQVGDAHNSALHPAVIMTGNEVLFLGSRILITTNVCADLIAEANDEPYSTRRFPRAEVRPTYIGEKRGGSSVSVTIDTDHNGSREHVFLAERRGLLTILISNITLDICICRWNVH